MSYLQAIVLGILQGATEFIPVSSSGHLVLVPWLLGWEPSGLAFTVVVHLGTVFGVLLFFRKDWINMAAAAFRWIKTRDNSDPDIRLLAWLVLGTIPGMILGLLFDDFFESLFQSPLLAALMLLVTAALLFTGERIGRQERTTDDLGWLDSLLIGCAQALAIIPGISRSGATITAGRMRHMKREDAARFSFLLSTPIIVGAGIIQVYSLVKAGLGAAQAGVLIVGFVAAFASAYLVIRWLLNFLRTRSTNVFALYCVLAAAASIVVFLLRGG